jgi:hypothetical protein
MVPVAHQQTEMMLCMAHTTPNPTPSLQTSRFRSNCDQGIEVKVSPSYQSGETQI